jgi:IQ calmodulin-binding motif.
METAATKIQAVHRGKSARRQGQKQKREKEIVAATKIQAIQRGKQVRRRVRSEHRGVVSSLLGRH